MLNVENFQYSAANLIDNFHSQLRNVTKTKRSFSSDMSMLKLLILFKKVCSGKMDPPYTQMENDQRPIFNYF